MAHLPDSWAAAGDEESVSSLAVEGEDKRLRIGSLDVFFAYPYGGLPERPERLGLGHERTGFPERRPGLFAVCAWSWGYSCSLVTRQPDEDRRAVAQELDLPQDDRVATDHFQGVTSSSRQ